MRTGLTGLVRRRIFPAVRAAAGERRAMTLALLPALVLFAMFTYYPLFMTLFFAFTDWNGYSRHFRLVGLANFAQAFQDPDTLQAFANTLYFAVLAIGVGLVVQFALALALSQRVRGGALCRTIIYIPAVVSPLIVALTWTGFLQYTGVVNEALRWLGLGGFAVNWLGDVHVVMISLVLVNTWQWAGLGMVILLTGLGSIPQEVREAAYVDGAVGFTHFRTVTLPLLMPALTANLFISLTGALRVFELPLVLTGGGPRNASTTMVLAIYNNAFGFQRFGFASSLGFMFFVFIASVTIVQLSLTRRQEIQY